MMSRWTAVIILVLVQMAAASVPARAGQAHVGRTGGHRLTANVVRHPVRHSRSLTVRRYGRGVAAVTRDFDPVPLGGGPIVNFVRDVEEVYGHDLPLSRPPMGRPELFPDF